LQKSSFAASFDLLVDVLLDILFKNNSHLEIDIFLILFKIIID
jgi:hypothetical protein